MKKIFTYFTLVTTLVISAIGLTGCDSTSDTIVIAEVTHRGVTFKTNR